MSCSLFAIPLNDEFVYVSQDGLPDKLGEAVKGLLLDCQPGGAMQVEIPYSSQPSAEKSFKKFLQVHIQQARSKGFDDTVSSGRHQHSQPLHFEVNILAECMVHTITRLLFCWNKKNLTAT
ncbi:hypothetical protein NQ314_019135 [Rhamnusium bicolor]|uniref:Uncharacterized protein n=1 Tax=Rhamnusium bicolor TaxID=1586634 RepID=A0AAV8WNM4_9CUCU|nr:hypothetical protein NQ314_019135 [Rhamnusium bicolor]